MPASSDKLSILALGLATLALFTGQSTTSGPIMIRDADGTSTYVGGGIINFNDANGKHRLTVGFSNTGRPLIEVNDSGGTLRLFIGESSSGRPMVLQYDGSGKQRVFLGEMAGGYPRFTTSDASGTDRLSLGQSDTDQGARRRCCPGAWRLDRGRCLGARHHSR